MAVSGNALLHLERKGMIVAGTEFAFSQSQDLGQQVPVGIPVAVLSIVIDSDRALGNTFFLQSGGSASPANDFFRIRLIAAGNFQHSFKHPLILDGLAAQWSDAAVVQATIQYKRLG